MSPKMLSATRIGLAIATCAVLAAACSSSEPAGGNGQRPPKLEPLSSSGTEGELNIIAWAGYAEDGSNDPSVDWVTPFEKETGCQTNVKLGNTSDEMVELMRSGRYVGVSASGDATLRLIYAGDVAPVNTSLVPNYESISGFLKDKSWNSVDGQNVRHPTRMGRQPADVHTSESSRTPLTGGRPCSTTQASTRARSRPTTPPSTSPMRRCMLSKTRPELGMKDWYSLTPNSSTPQWIC